MVGGVTGLKSGSVSIPVGIPVVGFFVRLDGTNPCCLLYRQGFPLKIFVCFRFRTCFAKKKGFKS